MKSEEYIQTIRACVNTINKIDDLESVLPYFDELRRIHTQFQNRLECLLVDDVTYKSQETKQEINRYAKDIIEVCKSAKIKYQFYKFPEDWFEFIKMFEARSFSRYFYNEINITDLIVFTRKKKQKINKLKEQAKIEVLGESQFTEEEGDSFITEGNDLPI